MFHDQDSIRKKNIFIDFDKCSLIISFYFRFNKLIHILFREIKIRKTLERVIHMNITSLEVYILLRLVGKRENETQY